MAGGWDAVTMGNAISYPGIDPRQWVSYGTVSPQQNVDGEVIDSVEFDDELGPLVNVRLQPSNVLVRCRVASTVAGAGEGEYVPFIENDEVLVVLPQGDEAASPCIIGRLHNSIDTWPNESVAGQDPTNNTFAFRRIRTPFIQEYAGSLMIRSATHGGFLLMSDNGTITLRDGSKGALQMGPDAFSYQEGVAGEVDPDDTPAPQAIFQLDLTGRRISLQMDDALLQINGSDADNNAGSAILAAPTDFQAVLGTNEPAENVATYESVLALLNTFATNLAPVAAGPAAITATIATMSTSGGLPLTPPIASALAAAKLVAAATPKGDVDPATGIQLLPGIGAVLFKTG